MRASTCLLGFVILTQTACATTQKSEKIEPRTDTQAEDQELRDKIEDLSQSITELAKSFGSVVEKETKNTTTKLGENKDELTKELNQLSSKMEELARQSASTSRETLKALLSKMEDVVDEMNNSLNKETID